MVIEVKPVESESEIDAKAMRIFLKTIEILGGPRKLVEHRNLTWLPSLMAASYALVYHKERNYTLEQIASILGITKQTVQHILGADPEIAKMRLEEISKESDEKKKTHIAGALAKLAYEEILAGNDEINLSIEITKRAAKSLGADWAFHILSRLKGTDFPVEKETLLQKLSGMIIKDKKIEDVLDKIEYPIKTPAELLHKIREAL